MSNQKKNIFQESREQVAPGSSNPSQIVKNNLIYKRHSDNLNVDDLDKTDPMKLNDDSFELTTDLDD